MGDSILLHQFQFFFSSFLIRVHAGIPMISENMFLAAFIGLLPVEICRYREFVCSACTLPAIFRIIEVGIRRNLFPADTIKRTVSKIAMLEQSIAIHLLCLADNFNLTPNLA